MRSATLPEGRKADRYPVSGRVGTGERTRELPGGNAGIFIVLSGFATSDLSVDFCDARQGGGAYGKTPATRPFYGSWPFAGLLLTCSFLRYPLILWITVLPPLSELIPLAAAERPSAASQ
jgi:hypothetical protein